MFCRLYRLLPKVRKDVYYDRYLPILTHNRGARFGLGHLTSCTEEA